jgi:hypothetical protein
MSEPEAEVTEPRFLVPLPGGRVARVPLEVLEQYVAAGAKTQHAGASPRRMSGVPAETTTVRAGASTITINVYGATGEVSVGRSDDDVVAHSLSVDPTTGTSEWHTDWEYGECEYTNDAGFSERIQAWHRHPFATEYTEIYEG